MRRFARHGHAAALPAILLFCFGSNIYCQSFDSGSTGADGDLTLTTPGTVNFDPKEHVPPLDTDGDNVFNFKTITIGAGVVLKLSGRIFSIPVYFLATGPVKIAGKIDLTGENGHPATNLGSERYPSTPGPGGYPGGVGGIVGNPTSPSAGSGPGGGAGNDGKVDAKSGTFTGSSYLIPLLGGSGGGGGFGGCDGRTYGGGGGAGGGAIVIASSDSITFDQSRGPAAIVANGGAPGCGGGHGSGGAIRLVAPIISGNAEIQTDQQGPSGLTRLEAFQQNFGCCVRGAFAKSLPFKLLTPTQGQPSIQVTTINGIDINANPFTFPDATINSSSPVTIKVAAKNIPVGTVPKLLIYSEFGPDASVDCSALQGTFQASTCSASFTFPTGGTRGFVKATW